MIEVRLLALPFEYLPIELKLKLINVSSLLVERCKKKKIPVRLQARNIEKNTNNLLSSLFSSKEKPLPNEQYLFFN